MHVFECTMKFGHMGSGKAWERAVRVRADNILQAMRRAKNLPGVKKGGQRLFGGSVLKVVLVH